jgi:hypothetical protein
LYRNFNLGFSKHEAKEPTTQIIQIGTEIKFEIEGGENNVKKQDHVEIWE